MNGLFPKSTVARKVLMGVTGLSLIGFLVMHLMGNMLVFAGSDMFNYYSHKLISNPLIYIAEAGLFLIFVYHIVDAIVLKKTEAKANPIGYETKTTMGKATVYSRTMFWTGLIIFIFVVIHVVTLKFGKYYETTIDGVVMRDLFQLVAEKFKNPIYTFFYVIVMGLLGFHLAHALQASIRSLGVSNRKYLSIAKTASCVVALVLSVGFAVIPLYFLFVH